MKRFHRREARDLTVDLLNANKNKPYPTLVHKVAAELGMPENKASAHIKYVVSLHPEGLNVPKSVSSKWPQRFRVPVKGKERRAVQARTRISGKTSARRPVGHPRTRAAKAN